MTNNFLIIAFYFYKNSKTISYVGISLLGDLIDSFYELFSSFFLLFQQVHQNYAQGDSLVRYIVLKN